MKLEVGMYVRTNKGEITKIVADSPYFVNIDKFKKDGITLRTLRKIDILKASHNIIDLIEVGDYVNGEKIGYIDDCDGAMREYYYDYEDAGIDVGHWQEEIKTIITHEQMEQMAYKVG